MLIGPNGKACMESACVIAIIVSPILIVLGLISVQPWLVSTIVAHINTCCRFEFELTGYLFKDYTFSSTTIKQSCDNTSCANFTIDDFLSKMESKIKQANKTFIIGYTNFTDVPIFFDASSAESTLAFVRASPLLILCHMVVFISLISPCCHKINCAMQVLFEILLISMTILSTAGVAVYSNIYINKIGFTFWDLGSGWKWAVALCSLILFCHMVLVCWIVSDVRDRRKAKAESRTRCIATISQPNNVQNYRSPTHQSQTNASQTQLPQNKITADNWLFVKLDDRDAIVDTFEIFLYEHDLACADDMDNAVKDLPKTIKLKINTFERSKKEVVIIFQKLLDHLWDQDLVGKGADAKNLSHNTLNVISVDPGYIYYNNNVRKYMAYRSVILKRIKRFGKLPCLNAAHCSPIPTTEFKLIMGIENVNTRLNEYLLFLGTNECNVENILNYGFDISKVKRPFLGKGIYFTDSPVKADQYTGPSTGCILLCRVILGNFIIRKTNPKSDLTNWTHLPCSRCLAEECGQHSTDERFDSLIYDQPHGLFREFVIFNTDQILVECVIKYNRVTDSENLDL